MLYHIQGKQATRLDNGEISVMVAQSHKLYATAILSIYPGPELLRPSNKLYLSYHLCHTHLQIYINIYARCHKSMKFISKRFLYRWVTMGET